MEKICRLAFRQEKEPIVKAVTICCDEETLAYAIKEKLVAGDTYEQLGNSLYGFRNSIVHAKEGFKYELFSQPIFPSMSEASKWRKVLQNLAWSALSTLK